MPLTPEAERRSQLLATIGIAIGTLRSASSNINIGEQFAEASPTVDTCKEVAVNSIARIRIHLDELESLLK